MEPGDSLVVLVADSDGESGVSSRTWSRELLCGLFALFLGRLVDLDYPNGRVVEVVIEGEKTEILMPGPAHERRGELY